MQVYFFCISVYFLNSYLCKKNKICFEIKYEGDVSENYNTYFALFLSPYIDLNYAVKIDLKDM